MCTNFFRRLSYLLCLFQISCFVASQRIPLHSSSFSGCGDEDKEIDVVCNIHSEELQIEPKNFGNELLVHGFIREFELKVANKIIPDCIMSFCVDFSRRTLPCDCIKEKYRKVLPNKDLKKALIFFLMYKVEDVQYEKDNLGKNILYRACEDGHLGIAKLLRKWDANLTATDKDENNALHIACLDSGSEAMVTWLLDECKMGLETKGQYERTPFLCAARKEQLGIAKLLRQRGANIYAKNEYENNALHYACLWSKSVSMTTWLLDECNIGIEAKGFAQTTPFLCAAQKGQLGIAKLLRQQGANINSKDEDGDNALHLACLFSGSVAMVEWLSDVCKIDKETKGLYEKTPFLCAAEKGKLSIAKLLKDRGANIHAKSENGSSALHFACLYSGSVAMVTWLLDECKLGLETKGQDEKTPFLCAAEKGQLAIAKLLRQREANIHAKDKDGDNALYYAKTYSNNEKMVNYLQELYD